MIEDKLLRSLGDQLGRFIGDAALREDMQKSLETVTQGAFARLDLVTREQFDAQIELLQQAREQIERFAQADDLLAGFRQLARALLDVAAIPGYQALLAEVHAESFRSPTLRRLEQEDVAAMQRAMADALMQQQRAGRLLVTVDASALATALLAAIEGLAALAGLQSAPTDRQSRRAIDALADLLRSAQPPPPRRRTRSGSGAKSASE